MIIKSWNDLPHISPISDKDCHYMPITSFSGYKFCTKCGWSSDLADIESKEPHIIRGEN